MSELVIKVGGEAGQGVFVVARTLGNIFTRLGYYVFGYPEYPSLIRGGHNAYAIVISDEEISTPLERNDIILAMNANAIKFHKSGLTKNGFIIGDKSLMEHAKDVKFIGIDVNEIIKEAQGTKKMENVVLMASLLAVLGLDINYLYSVIEKEFSRKGEGVVNKNKKVAEITYEKLKANKMFELFPPKEKKQRAYLSGNEAIALGAIKGGLKFYAGYPMTPASAVLHYLVKKADEHNIVVVQSEDEIAAANMAVGAGFAGVRSMTGTSGGGFALMTETVGMAALSETPVVFYIAQRTGPSTGMPTWTGQGDLFQVLGASQGEFLRIILAPRDAKQAFYYAGKALNLAEQFQLPVFLLTDKYLAESHFTVDKESFDVPEIKRGKIDWAPEKELAYGERYKRYKDTRDGISPRTFPSIPNGMYVATSYDHREDSYTSEDFEEKTNQENKRMRKLSSILKEMDIPEVKGNGDIALITWGSQYGNALKAQEMLKKEGIEVAVINFSWLYPLDKKVNELLNKFKHTIIVENNATGLFQKVLAMELGFKPSTALRKYNGRMFFPEQIASHVKHIINDNFAKDVYRIEKEEFEDFEFYSPWRY